MITKSLRWFAQMWLRIRHSDLNKEENSEAKRDKKCGCCH